MDPLILAPWRDLAIIWLVLLALIIMAVPGVLLFFAVKGLIALKRLIRKPLLQAQVWARRIQDGTTKATDKVAGVPIGIRAASTRAAVTTRGVFNYLIGR